MSTGRRPPTIRDPAATLYWPTDAYSRAVLDALYGALTAFVQTSAADIARVGTVVRSADPMPGSGVFATKPIASGQLVAVYYGALRKYSAIIETRKSFNSCYLFDIGIQRPGQLKADYCLDAEGYGDVTLLGNAHMFNHACAGTNNCDVRLVTVASGRTKMQIPAFYAARDIPQGAQLTIDYGLGYASPSTDGVLWTGFEPFRCACLAHRTGALGRPMYLPGEPLGESEVPWYIGPNSERATQNWKQYEASPMHQRALKRFREKVEPEDAQRRNAILGQVT